MLVAQFKELALENESLRNNTSKIMKMKMITLTIILNTIKIHGEKVDSICDIIATCHKKMLE